MKSATIATVAGLAATVAATGSAIVTNNCDYPVYIQYATSDAGKTQPLATLSNTDSPWSQQYTSCEIGGWSIKIWNNSKMSGDVMQYEYTYSGSDLWYDMSLIDSHTNGTTQCSDETKIANGYSTDTDLPQRLAPVPWAFSVDSSATFTPDNDLWYSYPNGPGSQHGSPDQSITLTLCPSGSSSGSSGSSGSSSSSSASVSSVSTSSLSAYSAPASSASTSSISAYSAPASSSSATQTTFATSTSAASSSSASSASSQDGYRHWSGVTKQNDVQAQTSAVVTSSAAVSTSVAADGNVVVETVVDYTTEVATAYVTARDAEPTPAAHRRHVHGHPHGAHRA